MMAASMQAMASGPKGVNQRSAVPPFMNFPGFDDEEEEDDHQGADPMSEIMQIMEEARRQE